MFSKLLFTAILPLLAHASTVTLVNSCPGTIRALLSSDNNLPADAGYLASQESVQVELTNFFGRIYADAGQGHGRHGEQGATKAVIDTTTTIYAIVVDSGFNDGVSIVPSGTQQNGGCTPAICTSADCTDALHAIPGPITVTEFPPPLPLHQCPGTNVSYTVTFCPVSTPPPPPAAVQIHPNGNNAKCLDVRAAQFTNGTPVQIFDCNGSGAQKWVINKGNTKVQVAGTNFCLDAGSNSGNNVGMKIWTCFDNLPAQAWSYTNDNRIALTGKGQCLDLTNGVLDNSNQIETFQCTDGNTNQIWTTTPV